MNRPKHNTWCAENVSKGVKPCDCDGPETTREKQRELYNLRGKESGWIYGPPAPPVPTTPKRSGA